MDRPSSQLSLRTAALKSVEQTLVDDTTTTTTTGTEFHEPRKDDAHQRHDRVIEEDAVCLLCYEPFDDDDDEEDGHNNNNDSTAAGYEPTSFAANATDVRNDETVDDLVVDLEVGNLPQGSPTSLSSMVPSFTSTTSTTTTNQTKRVRLTTCSHSFCHDCLNDYFRYMIRSHQVPIPCPTMNNPRPNSCCGKNNGDRNGRGSSTSTHVAPHIVYQVLLASAPSSTTTITTTTTTTFSAASTTVLPALRWLFSSPEGEVDPTHNNTTDGSSSLKLEHPGVCSSVKNATTMIPSTTAVLFDDPDWMKFVRLHRLYYNPSLIACTQCPALIEPTSTSAPATSSSDITTPTDSVVVVCPSCQHSFCTIHGDVHNGQSCHEYLNSPQYRQQQRSEQTLLTQQRKNNNAKPCSHCGMYLSKQGGCDHILCPMCHNDMCYHCGTHIYLSGKVIRSCAQCRQGFVDHRYENQYRCRLLLCVPFLLPGWILYSLITLCLAIVSGCFCGCFLCGWTDDDNDIDNTSDDDDEGGRDYYPYHKSHLPAKSGKFAPFQGIRQSFLYVFLPMAVFARDMGIQWQWLNQDLEAIFAPQHQRNQYHYQNHDRTNAHRADQHHHLRSTSTTTSSPASREGSKHENRDNDDTSVTDDNNPTEHEDDDCDVLPSRNNQHHERTDPLQL